MRLAAVMLTLAIVTGAHAGAIIKITSNEPARVHVDGEDLGVTPITLRDMKPGTYEVKLENVRTGMVQTYSIKSPKSGTVEREIAARWPVEGALEPSAVVAPAPVAAPQPSIEAELGSPSGPVAEAVAELAGDAPPVRAPGARPGGSLKAKARTALVGAAVANELLNKGKSKKSLRKAAVGIGLLNEALTK